MGIFDFFRRQARHDRRPAATPLSEPQVGRWCNAALSEKSGGHWLLALIAFDQRDHGLGVETSGGVFTSAVHAREHAYSFAAQQGCPMPALKVKMLDGREFNCPPDSFPPRPTSPEAALPVQKPSPSERAKVGTSPAAFPFNDLHSFKDYVGFVRIFCPDRFPVREGVRPEDQWSLDLAFAGLRQGMDMAVHEKGDRPIFSECNRLIEEAYEHYKAGAKREGFVKMAEVGRLLSGVRSW